MKRRTIDTAVLTAAVLGSLVLVNLIGVGLFGRLDLTRDRQFTLSAATRDTLKALRDPVTVRAYFTRDLPPPHSTNARYVKDLLEEYYAASRGNLRYEFVDPTAEETDADKEKKKEVSQDIFGRAIREETSVEKELRLVGIPPVQVRFNEGDKIEVKRAYMGISLRYGEKKEVIPVVSETSGLEYDLTTLLRKLVREKAPKVALIVGQDGPDPVKELGKLYGVLGQLYEVSQLDLGQTPKIPEDVTAILVVGPKKPFSEEARQAIDRFVTSGRSAAFLLGAVAPELSSLEPNPTDHGLSALLSAWGVTLEPGLVLDAECASLTVTQQRGFMRINQPVKYPFVPTPRELDAEHPLTRGLAEVAFPFMSPLSVAAPAGVKAEVLVKSSTQAWVQQPPYNLDPMQRWTRDSVRDPGQKNLVAILSGHLPGRPAAPGEGAAAGDARVFVAGGFQFVLDNFMSQGNQALALNLLDWLVQDEALLAVRSRGMAAASLDGDVSDARRNALKYLNVVGLPLLFVGGGLVRWRLRESRRAKASL